MAGVTRAVCYLTIVIDLIGIGVAVMAGQDIPGGYVATLSTAMLLLVINPRPHRGGR